VEEREASTNAHTPGPWTAGDLGRGVVEVIAGGDKIAQVWRTRVWRLPADQAGDLPAEANALLIAAAPELLAAAGLALAHLRCEYADPAQVAARDALVKAVAKAGGR
jgi:hypothetical protein